MRHLSSFCWAARAASGARGQRIDRDLFDRAARVLTIAATGVLSEPGLALSPTQIRSLTLPGRRRATYVAQRVKSEQSRMDDFERPLLGSEHAQGLWGSYASLAGILGLVDSSKRYPVLTPEGWRWAQRLKVTAFPSSMPAWFTTEHISDNIKALTRLQEQFDPHLWPTSGEEQRGFVTLLEQQGPATRHRLIFLMQEAARRRSLSSISRGREAKKLFGVDGTSLAELAGLGALLRVLVREVELPYRDRVSGGSTPPAPDLTPFKQLLDWAGHQGLDMGALRPTRTTWGALDRFHRTLFHRRGRAAWADLSRQGLLELPAKPRLPDFRFGALRCLADEFDDLDHFR